MRKGTPPYGLLDSDHGQILIKIPLYDPQIEGFLQACTSFVVGPVASGRSGFLGISMSDGGNGVAIGSLAPNGPGVRAGLKPGDFFTKINQKTITSVNELLKVTDDLGPGQSVTIDFSHYDQNQDQTTTVVLGARPSN